MRNIQKQLSFSVLALVGFAVLFGMFGFSPDTVFAQGDFGIQAVEDSGLGLSGQPIDVTIARLIRILLGFLGLVAVIIVLYGGYTYMTAGGNEDKIARAKLILRNGVIGLTIILFSFIIVQFVITKLLDATGGGGCVGDDCPDIIQDCPTASDCHVPMCGDKFGATSVTPKQSTTGMNNIVIRAVFTKSVETEAAAILTITESDGAISDDFTYAFVEGTNDTVLEAHYTLTEASTKNCDTQDGYLADSECLVVPGDFEVTVNSDIVATDGSGIEFGEDICIDGSGLVEKVEFVSDVTKNDTEEPIILNMGLIDPSTDALFTEVEPSIPSGHSYTFTATIDDAGIPGFGGAGYVEFVLSSVGEPDLVVYAGPSTDVSSSKDPYTFNTILPLSSKITQLSGAPKKYDVTLTAWDIDHNSTTAVSSFILKGNHCFNDVQDGDEDEGVNLGGSCGTGIGGGCTDYTECESGQCPDGLCVAYPMITNVDPMNGAPGNWVTVLGNYFGYEEGTIEFGSDETGWVEANLVECPGIVDGASWHNSFAIVEVPDNGSVEIFQNALSLGNSAGAGYVDFSFEDKQIDEYTVGIWAKLLPKEGDEQRNLFSLGSESESLSIMVNAAGTQAGLVVDGIDVVTKQTNKSGVGALDLSQWHMYRLSEYPDVTNDTKVKRVLSIDGQLLVSVTHDEMNFSDTVPPTVRIGASVVGDKQANAIFDEILVYDKAAPSTNFWSTMQTNLTNSDQFKSYIESTSPLAYWRLHADTSDASVSITNEISGDNDGEVFGQYAIETDTIFGVEPLLITNLASTAIKITPKGSEYSDTTVDDFGPKPVYIDPDTEVAVLPADGLFRYNDIERPGLCAVVADTNEGNITAGQPGTNIRAHGTGFGSSQVSGDQILFDVAPNPVAGEVSDWTEEIIRTTIPINFSPGSPLVKVKKGLEFSNGIPFQITKADLSDIKPLITDIDPADPTPGSFVTIFGNNFGTAGAVYITKEKGATCSNTTAGCIKLDHPPLPCKNTWSNTQIIVDINEDFNDFATHYVIVKRADNQLQSDGLVDVMSIQEGPPRPSICGLEPGQGPAPLPEDSPRLVLKGKNFTADPVLYFWNGSQTYNTTTEETVWDGSDEANDLDSGAWISWNGSAELNDDGTKKYWKVDEQGTEITSSVGYDTGGSMPFGQWPISIKASGVKGNSVQYFVTDCRVQDQSKPPVQDWQCCTEGPDTGSWKQICEGDVRSSGYVWRFTTGILPNTPYVLTQCDEVNWYDGEYDGKNPSPIPSTEWEESKNMCLNATVQVALSMGLDPLTITTDSVYVYECGDTSDDIDCDYEEEDLLSNLDLRYETGDEHLLIIKQGDLSGQANFSTNTWHRVILTDDITSAPQKIGGNATTTSQLQIDRSLSDFKKGKKVAFHYDFQTGTGFCTLNNAFITPKEKTVSQVGLLMDTWYPDLPFYYYVKGRADRKCTVLDVDALGWNWESNKPDSGSIGVAVNEDYTDSRATSTAILHTPSGVEFSAQTPPSSTLATFFPPDGVITADTSTLFINLGKPEVIYYEPNCAEACPNGLILARFNRHMDPNTFNTDNIILSMCTDPNCIGLEPVEYTLTFDTGDITDPENWLYVKLDPDEDLEVNTYYKVVLNEGVKSLGKLIPGATDGEELKYHEWVFRTKQDGTACAVDHVNVTPHPFTATFIEQKQKFTATPYGAPSECSAKGQELSRWDDEYEYEWSSSLPVVAEVTTFEQSLSAKTYCTEACLLSGSDVSYEYKEKPLCGNSIVDAGEDCDIDAPGEIIGLTCTLECLRPGAGVDNNYCGTNNVVDNPVNPDQTAFSVGEMCDPAATFTTTDGSVVSWENYCTNDCTLKGSSNVFNPAVSGYCGDGEVGYEEACDIDIDLADTLDNPEKSSLGCTASCLHSGTQLSAVWCETKADLADPDILAACQFSQSVCGNGILELGEQCERTDANEEFCSPSCLYYDGNPNDNDLDNGKIGVCGTEFEQCAAGTEGCTELCTYAGSSLFYSTPSLCGDGVEGIGEEYDVVGEPLCEEVGAAKDTTESPLQIATAIGDGVVTTGTQKTDIKTRMPGQIKNGVTVEGVSKYTLQCGFTEFEEPQNGVYNDCIVPLDSDPPVGPNGLGVGHNSCCSLRPIRTAEYPEEDAGLGNEAPVCRNTYIEVTFDTAVDPTSIATHAQIARGYETYQNCSAVGGEDVTDLVNDALGLASGTADASTDGFWSKLWTGVKRFFFRMFGGDVHAKNVLLKNIKTWCAEQVVLTTNMFEPSTKVPLYISNVLGEDAKHTAYAVLLEGGKDGISTVAGVGIKHKTEAIIHDAWAFEVGTEVCKINDVLVDPASYLFAQPNTSTYFGADAATDSAQLIVPTPPYNWEWAWQPQASSIFDIPADGFPIDSQFTKLGSTNVEGTLTAVAQAIVIADVSTENNHLGKIFEGETKLTSLFCEHPWPAPANGSWFPYEDDLYEFSFSYCADAGQSGNTTDDLPFFVETPISVSSCTKTISACGVDADCENTFDVGPRTYAGDTESTGLCEIQYKGSPWIFVEDFVQGTYYGFGCTADAQCQNPNRYVDDGTGSYYSFLLPGEDLSSTDLTQSIEQAVCNTSRPIQKQQCEGIAAGALKKILFVSDTNSDGIGMQIFENPNRMSAAEWFADRFPAAAVPQQVEIADYDAVADQDNYYINALNVVRDDSNSITAVYNNIYLFSISQGSQESTRNVFGQILDSLEFNTNLTDHGYCVGYDDVTPDYINACSTNFDCILGQTDVVLSGEQVGICSTDDVGAFIKEVSPFSKTIYSMTFLDESEGWAGGHGAHILKTSNGGAYWTLLYDGASDIFDPGDVFYDLQFVNSEIGWGAIQRLAKTTDGGEHWEKLDTTISGISPLFTSRAVHFVDEERGVAVGLKQGTNPTSEIYRTVDGGETWNEKTGGLYVGVLLDVAFVDANVGVAIGVNGLILRTTDGGESWTGIDSGTSNSLHAVEFFNSVGWIVGTGGTVLYTNDGGKAWTIRDSGTTATLNDVSFTSVVEGLAVDGQGGAIRTNDGGQSWESITFVDGDAIHVVDNVNNVYYAAGQNGLLLRSTQSQTDSCTEDSNCENNNVCIDGAPENSLTYQSDGCHAEKTKLLRDWDRLHDVKTIQLALENVLPPLNEGTFRKNYVASVWPSWGSFGNTVGQNLPQDPINVWDGCNPADPQTCWDPSLTTTVCDPANPEVCSEETKAAFICPQHASVYEYAYDDTLGTYSLHIPMEFFTNELFTENAFSALWIDQFVNTPYIVDSPAFTTERGCDPGQAYTFIASQCGDGVVSPGEQCDPPGKQTLKKDNGTEQCATQPIQEYATATCTEQCTWDYGACAPLSECGNGIVDAGEACDDGSLNGTYGQCSAKTSLAEPYKDYSECLIDEQCNDGNLCTVGICDEGLCEFTNESENCSLACQGLHVEYCGNGRIDYNLETGDKLEFCDWSVDGTNTYDLTKEESCRWDCQGYGSYCGDGFVDLAEGEECDDGNSNSLDACSASCQIEDAFACLNEGPPYIFDSVEGSTDIFLNTFTEQGFAAASSGLPPYDKEFIQSTGAISQCFESQITGDDICASANIGPCIEAFVHAPCDALPDDYESVYCLDYNSAGGPASMGLIVYDGFVQGAQDSSCDIPLEYVGEDGEENYYYSVRCTGEYTGPLTLGNDDELIIPQECGNSKLEAGEQCDPTVLGTKVFADCENVGYGDPSCTYCTDQCSIETKEATGFCGDGVVDFSDTNGDGIKNPTEEWIETCDILGDTVRTKDYFFGLADASCTNQGFDSGSVSCQNSCQSFVTGECYSCGIKKEGTEPSLQIINPMVQTQNVTTVLDSSYPFGGFNQLFTTYLYVGDEWITEVDLEGTQFAGGTPLPFEIIKIEDGEENEYGLESKAICSGECAGGICTGGYHYTFGSSAEDVTSDSFPFELNGDIYPQSNDFVLSPAVREGSIRIVVRWTGAEQTDGGFVGAFYQKDEANDEEGTILNYGVGLSVVGGIAEDITLGEEGYWIPPVGYTNFKNGIYIHPVNNGNTIYTQSFTVEASALSSSTEPLAFYVHRSGLSPIYSFQDNKNVVVDVYTHHAGQDATFSVFGPTYSYTIADAIKSNSGNAEIWHVFNLIDAENLIQSEVDVAQLIPGSSAKIVPTQIVERDQCEIHNNIYSNFIDCNNQ